MSAIAAPSTTEPAVIPAAISNEPVAGTPTPVGNLGNREVKEIVEKDTKNHTVPNSKLLKVLAVILIVISIATILAGLTIGIGLIAKGTALIQYMPYMVVGLTIMGPTGAKIAAIAFAVFGGLGTWGGFALWKHSDNLHTTETITKTKVLEGQTIKEIVTVTQQVQGPTQIVHVPVPTPVPTPVVPTPIPDPVVQPKPPKQQPVIQGPTSTNVKNSKQNYDGIHLGGPIKKVPEFLYSGNLYQNCEELLLSNNEISELPDGIGILKNVKKLNLANNKFANLKNIDKLTGLEELDVRGNKDLGNIDDITKLPNLKTLHIDAGKEHLIPTNVTYKVDKS